MKKQVQIVKKGQDDGNIKYWRSLTPAKRLKNLEALRKEINKRKYDTQQGFQRDFITSLNENDVKHLIVGGYAVNLNGYPRYTKDIDFWIKPAEENIKKLLSAINDFGFGSLDLDEQDFESADNIIQLGRAPYRIDLLTDIDGIDFDKCYERKNNISVERTDINYLNIEDLITAKKESGRLQDLADAEELEKINKGENR